MPCRLRYKDPLAGADLVRIFNAVDPSQFLIIDAVSLAYAKEVLLTLDDMIDTARFFLVRKARARGASIEGE